MTCPICDRYLYKRQSSCRYHWWYECRCGFLYDQRDALAWLSAEEVADRMTDPCYGRRQR